MIEAPQPRNGKSNWWKEVISVLRNGWLTTAIAVEVLGLLAAFATIPGLPLPTALMLSVTGILSAGGVLIVTVYFMLQYNRRPLNYIQVGEVSNMLSPYLRSELAKGSFVPKSELSELVQGFGLYWQWQYQESIVELRRAIDQLRSQPGFVIVAQSGTPEGPGARFAQVAPPSQVMGQPLGISGEELPEEYNELGKIFGDHFKVFVFYQGANRTIRYLEMEQGWQKAHYDDNTASPIIVSENQVAPMPQLRRVTGTENYKWKWVTSPSA